MAYRPRTELATHNVKNQPTPLDGTNLFWSDPALVEAVSRHGAGWGDNQLAAYGAICGDDLMALGFEANANPPTLQTFDRLGQRIDEVSFHPAYHRCMEQAKSHGLHSLSWSDNRSGAQVLRSALVFMHNQVEAGTMCPITMTHAAVPSLRHAGDWVRPWLDGILANAYDPTSCPASQKTGLTIGMGMSEKQGGSDVRRNTTVATRHGGDIATIRGHKWFFSAPMSDGFLVLAQEVDDSGLSCFLMPRWRADGQRNTLELQRLKNKLGDRSNASSEVEFFNAEAYPIGEAGRGVATIIDMVSQTRLDCMLGSAGQMRQSLAQAVHHCRQREAFGKRLIEQPLMARVLADLALESEAATALAMRLAQAFERSVDPVAQHEHALARLATPIGKYFICKAAPGVVNEALECVGGNGYIEESILPRLFRQSPLNSIWEGAGNVQCLDLLRAVGKTPGAVDALRAELREAAGGHSAYDGHLQRIESALDDNLDNPAAARHHADMIARGLQAKLLLTGDHPWLGEVFCQTRLASDHFSPYYGGFKGNIDTRAILDRTLCEC